MKAMRCERWRRCRRGRGGQARGWRSGTRAGWSRASAFGRDLGWRRLGLEARRAGPSAGRFGRGASVVTSVWCWVLAEGKKVVTLAKGDKGDGAGQSFRSDSDPGHSVRWRHATLDLSSHVGRGRLLWWACSRLGEVVVDAEGLGLGDVLGEARRERTRLGAVAAKGLLDDDAAAAPQVRRRGGGVRIDGWARG